MALEILTDNYSFVLIVTGIIGFLMGFDRITQEDEEESKILQILGGFGGVLLIAVIILAIINEVAISKYTIVFSVLFGISLIAKPFKKLPIAFAVSAIIGLILTYFVLSKRSQGDETFFGTIPLKFMIIVILIIVVIVFIVSFIQEATMDALLWLLSWGIFVFILALITFLQGVTLLLEIPDVDGILGLLPG